MSALTEDKLGPVEKSLNQDEAADAYDWDAVTALEQIERARRRAIEAAVREHSRQALEDEAALTGRSSTSEGPGAD
jgi:hypothetical protein